MARLLIEGFEFASVDHLIQDPRRTLDYYFPTNISGMDGYYCFCPVSSWIIMPLASSASEVFVSMLIRWHNSTYNDYVLAFLNSNMQVMGGVVKTSAGYLRACRGDIAATLATDGSAISSNTTYRLGVQYLPHDSAGVFKVYLDGNETARIDFSGDTSENTANVAYIAIGTNGTTSYGTHHYIDNVVVDSATMPGATKVRRMLPADSGNSDQWSSSGGNNIIADSECVGLYRLEPANYETDSSPSLMTLIAVNSPNVEYGVGNYKEGNGSVKFIRSNSEYFYFPGADDTNLPTGYPLKSGDTTKKFAGCCWVKPLSTMASGYAALFAKWNWGGSQITFNLGITTSNQLYSSWGYSTGQNQEAWNGDALPQLVVNRWYHIGISIDGVAKTSQIRIWDEYNQTATTYNDTYANALRISNAPFSIGGEYGGSYLDGILDEVAFFNNTKATTVFDSIRQGTYLSAKAAVVREVPASIADYIYSNSTGDKQLFTLSAPPSNMDTIHAVLTRVSLVANGLPTPRNVKPVVRTHSTDYDGSDIFAPWMQPGAGLDLRTVNPNTSSAWTSEELAALEVGVKAAT